MTDEEKEFSKKVNVDKANININTALAIIGIDLVMEIISAIIIENTNIIRLFFEIISLFFLLVSKKYCLKYNEDKARKMVIVALTQILIGFIIDFILFLIFADNIIDVVFLAHSYYYYEFLLIGYVIVLFGVIRDLSKANNPIKYKESTDWFYEKYEDKKEVRK